MDLHVTKLKRNKSAGTILRALCHEEEEIIQCSKMQLSETSDPAAVFVPETNVPKTYVGIHVSFFFIHLSIVSAFGR
jgi:hypothetical protein